MFLTALLHLASAIWICTKEGADWLPVGGDGGEGAEISFTEHDLNRSLTRNSWKKSKNRSTRDVSESQLDSFYLFFS